MIRSDQDGTVGNRGSENGKHSPPADRCPWPRPFPADFSACPAYQPAGFVVADSLNRTLGSERTCHHLVVGSESNGHGPRFYPRCALGGGAARLRWLATVRPERAAVRRALREEFDEASRPDRERLFSAGARAAAAPPGSTAERAELEGARDALTERARRFAGDQAERLADAGEPVAPLLGMLDWQPAPGTVTATDEFWLVGRRTVAAGDDDGCARVEAGNLETVVTAGPMEVARRRRPPGLLVSGEIDTTNAETLGDTLAAELAGRDEVHLDLASVLFCDLGGVRAIVRAAQSAGDGHRVVVHGMPGHLRRALRVAGWSDLPSVVVDAEHGA